MKPSIVRGMRDLPAPVLYKRRYILHTIREVFERYGFEPLETPAMEQAEVLDGKYGEEGDKLMFRVLDNGDIAGRVTPDMDARAIVRTLSEKALRYDLTIPLARHVAMHHGTLVLPFKRYQMQNVWRGDKPQRGRYREFLQCDADVLGSEGLVCELELLQIYDEVFSRLQIPSVHIRINSRKILHAFIALLDEQKQAREIITLIDKIDKIGEEKVLQAIFELLHDPNKTQVVRDFFALAKPPALEQLEKLRVFFSGHAMGEKGVEELRFIFNFFARPENALRQTLQLDVQLARGIDYYTGMIVEVGTRAARMSSLGGGGRYDDLASSFGAPAITGVGISFGVDRLYDVMDELALFPKSITERPYVILCTYMHVSTLHYITDYARRLRAKNYVCELYPTPAKLDRQLRYASRKNIPWVVLAGEDEMRAGKVKIKNMHTGEECVMPHKDIGFFEKNVSPRIATL